MSIKPPKAFLILLKLAVILAVVIFIAGRIAADWKTVKSFDWQVHPLLLTLSFAGFFGAYALLVRIWSVVLASLGYTVSYGNAWDIYFIGNLGRYIPGKVWTVAGIAYMAGKSGIPAVIAGTSAVCAQAYSILSSFVFFVMFLIFKSADFAGYRSIWILPVPVILMVIFLRPANLERVLNSVLVRLGRKPVTIELTTAVALKITGLYLISWFLFGGAFWLFVAAVTGDITFNPLFLAGAYAVSYVGGFLAFFVPGGIGVREGILSVLLTGTVPAGVAVVIAVSSRLIITCVELVCVAIVFIRKGLR